MGSLCCIHLQRIDDCKEALLGSRKKKRSTLDEGIFDGDEDYLNDPEIRNILENNDVGEELSDDQVADYIKSFGPV